MNVCFCVLEMMREMEDIAWRDLGRLELGLAPSRARRVSSLLSDARIRSCSRQIMNREMDMLHFLSSVSLHLDASMQDMFRDRTGEEARPPSPLRGPPRMLPDNDCLRQVSYIFNHFFLSDQLCLQFITTLVSI